MLFKAVDTWRR